MFTRSSFSRAEGDVQFVRFLPTFQRQKLLPNDIFFCSTQVDYGATAEELEAHFHGCGSVNRVTILCNKFDGQPKGFAYIEFTDKESVQMAMAMDESLFRARQIKVIICSYCWFSCIIQE
jgi:RNA recognition motif-containing protein